jgi:putative SbcD/Mre11-related phosphoesterase
MSSDNNPKLRGKLNSSSTDSRDFTAIRLKPLYKHRAIVLTSDSERKRYLVVSDLHIGFEEKFRGAGISIQPRIDKITTELLEIIAKERITHLIVNGDVKSGTDRITRSEWDNVPKFFDSMLSKCSVAVIPGNHDGGLQYLVPNKVELLDSNGAMISDTLILHGHTRPLAKFHDCRRVVMGHVHPIYMKKGSPLSGQPVWVFMKAPKKNIFRKRDVGVRSNDGASSAEEEEDEHDDNGEENDSVEVILMPSFNLELVVAGFALDAARQERRMAPLLRDLHRVPEAMVITLDGDLIGDASLIPQIL